MSTVYVALLRGINVGGNAKVEMPRLRALFEELGFGDVKTYINSGNVVFSSSKGPGQLKADIEAAIETEFHLTVPVVLRSREEIAELLHNIPDAWVNNAVVKCDVMFLWPELDTPAILERIPHRPEIEDVVYFPGAVVWRVDKKNVNRGQVLKIIGTDVYRKLTIRNPNTVRNLYAMMKDVE